GAFANPVDGAVLLFKGDSPEVAERFAKADPYVTGGAVKRWYVREWTTVAGAEAETPVHSDPITEPVDRQESLDRNKARSSSVRQGAILRMWRGRSTVEKANEYVLHVTSNVFPKLEKIPGNKGAFLLQHPMNGGIEFVVLTLWDSKGAIQQFAGP